MAARLKPVESDNLGQRVYAEIRSALADGRYHPGERLRLRDLADDLGVSVTPVRDAVLQLVSEGALHMSTPRDIRVRSLSADEYSQIALIRQQLEGLAVEHFTGLMRPHDLEILADIEEKHQSALARRDYRSAVALDRRFIFTIFEAAGMPMLLDLLDQLWLVARPTVGLLYSDEGAARVDLGNRTLLDALASGDAGLAAKARRAVIGEGAEVIIDMLEDEGHQGTVVSA